MSLRERLRSTKTRPAATDPAPQARIHIDANGDTIIDLRQPPVPMPATTTTDMPCHNCGSIMSVEAIDEVAHMATLRCTDCGFHYDHRLTNY